jgi:putative DNA primase/helicase
MDEEIIITNEEIEAARQKNNVTPIRPINIEDYKAISPEEMAEDMPPPLEYVFYPCLPTQGIAWIYAATGMGKTTFTLNLAYAIASGGRFLNYTCPKPRKVLYVDGEMAYNQLHSRVMAIREDQGILDFPNNLKLLTPDKIRPLRIPKIDDIEGQYIYERKLVEENFEVVVFDNMAVLSTHDQLKGAEWKKIIDWQLKLRSLGKSIINVHHSGKDVNGYRGASDMIDTADVAISLQPVYENGLEEEIISTQKIKVKYSKHRNFGGKDALPFEVTFSDGKWSCRSMEKSEMDMVVEMVGLKMNQRDISKDTGLSLGKVNKLIRKAKYLRLIRD